MPRLLLALSLGVGLLLVPAPIAAQPASGSARSDGWQGTIQVNRHGSASRQLDDETHVAARFTTTISYQVQPDGSATYSARHDEHMTLTKGSTSKSVHISGSGSGTVAGGADHMNPDRPTQLLLGVKPGWILGAGGPTLDLLWDVPNEDVLGGMLAPIGIVAQMQDETEERLLPDAWIETAGRADVTTLSGSGQKRSHGYNVFWPMEGTETISYSLARGPLDPTPRVVIHGAPCGCLDPDNPSRKALKYFATASRSGGEFSEFSVKAEGRAPEILLNTGGETAALELAGDRHTGAVVLTISYKKDGRTYRAEPVRVEFCTIDRLELARNDTDLAFDLDGMLRVQARGKTWHNGRDVSDDMQWELEAMGASTRIESEPSPARGEEIETRYVGLPEKNTDFGTKRLTGRYSGGQCECQRQTRFRAFFIDLDDSHPGRDGTPNWFYYWKQTSAVPAAARPLLRYRPSVTAHDGGDAIATYEHRSETIVLSDGVMRAHGCRGAVDPVSKHPTGMHNEGIDCLAETVRHEMQHRQDAIEWWGSPRGPYDAVAAGLLSDPDMDHVPTSIERSLPGCSPISKHSCDARPFDDVTDAEIRAYYAGWSWPPGSTNREDWSCGALSKQWGGRACQ